MSKICAGIALFQPDIDRLKQSLESVLLQMDRVYLIDNHSPNIEEIRKLSSDNRGVVLIENDHNEGIARALNQMCENAMRQGYVWILTLDQDTVIPTGMLDVFRHYLRDREIGIICPAVYYEGWNQEPGLKGSTEYVYACMTSASLTRLKAWEDVGGFRDDYFIDYVDNDFCMKLGLHQYKILRVNTCQIKHRLGESGVKRLLWIRIRYVKHSPQRLYYMARNNYSFIKEYRENLPVLKEMLKLCYVLSREIIFSDRKMERLRYIRRGIRDAKHGISGRYRTEEGIADERLLSDL